MPLVRSIASMLVLLAVAGCGVTEPNPLEDFRWIAVENADEVTEGIDAAPFFGDINVLGQFKTPTLCFNVDSDFERNGSTLTIRVTARPSNATNCQRTPGGYRYTAVLRRLGSGTYTLRVVHAVSGAAEREFTETVELR
jgi:hypothetical protein